MISCSLRSKYKDEGEDDDDVNKGSDFVSVCVSFEPVITKYNTTRPIWLKCFGIPAWIVFLTDTTNHKQIVEKTKIQVHVTIRTN